MTDITMLEYMLIRSEDRPILDASQGKLEFMVLDEVHTYVGSQAAELALLLRRVTQAFGVDPGKVRFVATSATIGGEGDAGTRGALRRFLADIGGVPESRVHVIEGSRVVPPLPDPQPGLELPTPSELAEMDGQARYARLAACPQFRKAYDALRPRPASVSEWAERLGVGTDACERLLEAAAGARADVDVAGRRETHALLPLRIHAFHRTEPGIFVCINPSCRGRAGTKLDHAAWRYGAVFHERVERCPDCQSLILELKLCSNCGNETLTGERITNRDATEEVRLPSVSAVDDEFEQGLVDDEQQPPDGGQEDANETDEVEDDDGPAKASVLLTASGHGKPCAIHRTTGKVMGTMGAEAVLLQATDEVICPSCSATLAGRGNARLYSFRLGAPFLLGNIIPELLEDASASDTIRQGSAPRFRPADGKQLLTFTDSRQGTARLSAKLQAEAERNYVRAFIYHAVQNAAGGGGNADELERLNALLARTCLEGRIDRVVEEARAAMSAGETLFRQIWAPLNFNLSELEQTVRKAIELQQGRLERTFVLAELAAHGFLPAYGFPTDVVEFDNSGPWTQAHPRRGGGEIEPGAQPEGGSTRFAPRSMPSRSLDLAIRDYAPRTEVVLDGLVYRSAGVSLAWRRPVSADGVEHIEALRQRQAWASGRTRGSCRAKAERRERDALQVCHTTISLLKRWLLGTHAGAVGPKHLQAYLDEFAFRQNRRKTKGVGRIAARVIERLVARQPLTMRSLIDDTRRCRWFRQPELTA